MKRNESERIKLEIEMRRVEFEHFFLRKSLAIALHRLACLISLNPLIQKTYKISMK